MQITRADGLIDIDQAAQLARVRTTTIRQWITRGHLRRAGLDYKTAGNGRTYQVSLFRPGDVTAAEAKLRKAARRIIIPPAA